MKVTSIEVHPDGSSQVIVLSFRDPKRLNPYNVRKIVGLDADEIVPRYYGVSGTKKYYTLSLEKRDIVMQIELNPSYSLGQTPSDLRDAVYKMISSSRTGVIEVQFKNGSEVVAAVSGFVSKVENDLSEKTSLVNLTIACKEPFLKAPERTSLNVLSLDPLSSNLADIKSSAPHGFIFEMGVLSPISSLVITPPDDSWYFTVTPPGGFLSTDVIHFSSELNNKYLFVRRSGSDIHLAESIVAGSVWPILFPGDNVFEFANEADLTWVSVAYYPTYWGV